ncbi:permease prefix domain 1-containing protein [Dactylosporangium sp. AC04546]|uniref:permease prefix domain 1-containing protein n=1 Tax=Dactylosporangium sp. AC04546 TaxID=2862460 RepID=UPI001EDFD246|nr:permease prefix domain 1-containing protein [Dactylosporangium sp. AC04546]WVK80586.1 permease prefix domain 1-containing protein [Dactylosporangium sp. AC04546]
MSPSAPDRIEAYLDAVTRALPAGRRARAAIRAELADGLACAVDVRLARGAAPPDAVDGALAEFGPPAVVARAFARELLVESAHRTGLGLLCGGPLVGMLWVLAMSGAGLAWPDRIHSTLAAVPAYLVVLALVVPAAVLAAAAGGRFEYRLRLPGALAAQVAVAGCVAGDVLLLAAVLSVAAGGWAVWAAGAASGVRLIAAALAGRRVTRLRAAAR